MKKTIVLAMMALAIVALPATAQSRKDKKAAKKAEWEMQQQQKAEEAALLHQMKMDSIRDAQAAREAAKAEAEAKRKAEQAEQEYLQSTQTYNLPCWEADSKEYFTAHVQRVMPLNMVTTQSTALLRLAKLLSYLTLAIGIVFSFSFLLITHRILFLPFGKID